MTIWIQSLSWTLIYALGQGFVVYVSLWLVLKMFPAMPASARYHLSLSALTILLAWFGITWWQQFHTLAGEQSFVVHTQNGIVIQPQLPAITAFENYSGYYSILSSVQAISPWLSAFYFTGLVLMLARLCLGMLHLFSLRKKSTLQAAAAFDALLISLKEKLYFKGTVRLFISAKAPVPMVVGFLKPIILIPASVMSQLSPQQLETILLHELAHIKRHDYLINILQTIVETILFFNPFVWMISAITRREREHCCDDLVLQHSPEPLCYASALAALATHRAYISSLSVAASGQSNYLFNRIKRIMEMKKNSFSYSKMAAAILIIAAITCSAACFTPSFAHPTDEKGNKANASASVPKDVPVDDEQEASQLVQRLINDRMVNEIKGFVVEKRQNKLYINGQEQAPEVAGKYLPMIKKEEIRVQVFSLQERLDMHPEAGFLQNLIPVKLSSPCIDYKQEKKPGC